MHDANVKIIARLKRFVMVVWTNPESLKKFSVSEQDFVRNRKLPFPKLALLIIKLWQEIAQHRTGEFF